MVVLGMGDGSMTTLVIADPEKTGMTDFLASLPSRNPERRVIDSDGAGRGSGRGPGGYLQNGVEYPSPYDYSIYTDYLKVFNGNLLKKFVDIFYQALQQCNTNGRE